MRPLHALMFAIGLCASASADAAAVVTTEQVRAELVAHAPQGVVPGQPLQLGLLIEHKPHWHTYWKNPGDSGLPTALQWQLPSGAETGEIEWPTPRRLPIGPLVNYGYEGRVLLPVSVKLPAAFAADSFKVKLHADWLVCKDVCIPESGEFELSLPARAGWAVHGADFEAARAALPLPAAGAQATAELSAAGLRLSVDGLPAALHGQTIDIFPEDAGVLDNAATPTVQWQGTRWIATLPLSPQRSASPDRMSAVLSVPGRPAGVQVAFAVAGRWPAVAAAAGSEISPAVVQSQAQPQVASLGVGVAMLFALLGGALLNLMPCVFPILSLKVLGFAANAHDRRALAAGGLAYTLGVVLSFVALAGLLLLLRSGGEQLGWGFQLQSPGIVAALALLFTLIGLNLAGLFEFGSLLPSRMATLRAGHPLADSLLTGILAVAVASPCTAPFMGASLGLAATLPVVQALAIFAALGMGMALPYLLLSLAPGLTRWLPRPGMWMAQFRAFMAFPMFATVVWLAWVLGQQSGIDAVAALLAVLVALAFACWSLGSAGLSRRGRWLAGSLALASLAAASAWLLPALSPPPQAAVAKAGALWQPWSAERVHELRSANRPVFVDFTAAWCVTCQVNKRMTLSDAALLADFEARGVALLRADWTRRDEAITAELARLGRNGVPVYVLYAPSGAAQVLSEILSVAEVRGALQGLGVRAGEMP